MNITFSVGKYIDARPSVKDCLKKNLINYSSLSRSILSELNLHSNNFDAVLIACRRHKQKIQKEEVLQDRILKILKTSKIEIKTGIISVVVEKGHHTKYLEDLTVQTKKQNEPLQSIEGTDTYTIITSREILPIIKKIFKSSIIVIHEDLAKITIQNSREIETTPGVISYLVSLFAERGINIVETMSCWTDTIFLIREDEIGNIIPALNIGKSGNI